LVKKLMDYKDFDKNLDNGIFLVSEISAGSLNKKNLNLSIGGKNDSC